MVSLQSLSLVGISVCIFFGQLLRLNTGNIDFPLIDLFLGIFAFIHIALNFKRAKNRYFLWFIIFSWVSLAVNYIINPRPFLEPIFYLIRLCLLLSLFTFESNLKLSSFQQKLLTLALISNLIFGLLQYLLWPDLTYFKALGWDDHLHRLVSTYLDPTFTGLIYLLFLIHIFFKKPKNIWLMAIVYLAIALTYSRSTMLSLLVTTFYYSLTIRKFKYILIATIIVVSTVFLLPRKEGEGTKLERTSSPHAKIENYKEGLKLFAESPIIGQGYNNLVNLREATPKNLHSRGGFDGSLMTILVTNGIIGLTLFILGLWKMFYDATLEKKVMLIAILIHSLFANSLLYPWILLILYLL